MGWQGCSKNNSELYLYNLCTRKALAAALRTPIPLLCFPLLRVGGGNPAIVPLSGKETGPLLWQALLCTLPPSKHFSVLCASIVKIMLYSFLVSWHFKGIRF